MIRGPDGRPRSLRSGSRAAAEEVFVERKQKKLRIAMLSSVDEQEIMQIMDALIERAKEGNISAAREVLDRVIGKADESSLVKRLEELERMVLDGNPAGED